MTRYRVSSLPPVITLTAALPLVFSLLLGACNSKSASQSTHPAGNSGPALLPSERSSGPELLKVFESDQDLAAYVADLEKKYREKVSRRHDKPSAAQPKSSPADEEPEAEEVEESEEAEADEDSDDIGDGDDEGITNNQEEGVDEGGIIKVHGDHLVILRRGRLFSVRIGKKVLQPISMIDVFAPGGSRDAWYDEMLIHKNNIVVIGYSYGAGGTELGLFHIDDKGNITYRDTYYLRSNDYYSSRNYASRLMGNTLIFYMPYALAQPRWDGDEPTVATSLPGVRHYKNKNWNDIIASNQIYRPIQPATWPVLHTVVTCDLSTVGAKAASRGASPDLSCAAKSVLGPYSRSFYVSRNAVYIWVGGNDDMYGYDYDDEDYDDEDYDEDPVVEPTDGDDKVLQMADSQTAAAGVSTNAVVYRMPLDGSTPGAVRVWGNPTDQFSFKESKDGHLNVLVRAQGGGDAMWDPEVTGGDVALLRLPTAMFSTRVPVSDRVRYASLPRPERGWTLQNRFVGDYVLYGTGNSWDYYKKGHDPQVFIHPYTRPGTTTALKLPHGVDRIEALGKNAVIVGSDGKDLHFSAVSLTAQKPALADRYTQKNASQGETRSHGFFYKRLAANRGMLGLPIQSAGRPGYAHLIHGSASVLYLSVDDLRFKPIGELTSRSKHTNDNCQVSCVDWYGNSRPIFLRGRIFALLGYELVEGQIRAGTMREVARTNFYTQRHR